MKRLFTLSNHAHKPIQRIVSSLLSCVVMLILSLQGNCTEKVSRIVIGDIFDVSGQREAEPLQRLSNKLKEKNQQKTFRLIWGSSGTYSYDATVLYNRGDRTLKYYSLTYIGGLGNGNIQGIVKQWVCRKVTDKMIHQLAAKHKRVTGASNESFLSELPRYGAKIHLIENRQIAHLPSTKP